MKRKKFKRVLNASYSPNFNPIEGVIGLLKTKIKKIKLRAIVHEDELDLEEEIIEKFYDINKKTIQKFVSKRLLKEFV